MNNKEKRIISKIFTRLFFTYKKDMAVFSLIKKIWQLWKTKKINL